MAVTTSSEYKQVIYSGGANHSLKLWINDVLQENIENNIEEITMTLRVFPNGSNTFNINELVSKEVKIILHDIPYNTKTGQIKFSIGTYIDSLEDYEYVPMGIYNIEEIEENENNKITIKLRDNSIKLDVSYNAKPLIDDNDGTATLLQILNDICDKCEITSKVESFNGDDKLIGIYDNTINARIYVNYIAGQAGAIPIIDRDGELNFVYVNNLTTHKIPLDIVESYELGEPFNLKRVVYESGIIKYEKNQLPSNYTQVDYIQSTGTQYIDTGVVPNANTRVVIDSETSTSAKWLFGSRSSSGATDTFGVHVTGNGYWAQIGGNDTSKQITVPINNVRNVIDVNGTTLKVNGVVKKTYENILTTGTYDIRMFGIKQNVADTRYFVGKIYGMQIYNGETLVRNFIPCYRNLDNVIGMYDLVNNTFYTNKGTGAFSSGFATENDTLYIDSANLYINSQEQIDNIYDIVKDFSIDSVSTEKVMGDPAIDPYDLIQVYGYYDSNNNFVNDENTIVFTTFANNNFRYMGKCISNYETKISKELRKSNISLKSEETYKKNIKTEIDLINGSIKLINDNYLSFLQTASNANYVEIENMYANGITKLEISGQMSLLYPSDTLYPSNTLYPLDSYLVIEDEDENKSKYPLYINYLNVGDKYVYTYEFDEETNGYIAKAKIIRSNQTEETLDAPIFEMPSGNYKLYLENFTGLNYNVDYVIHNDLTDTLATNTQLSTSITQTRNEIDIKASQMVNKDNIIADLNVGIQNGQGIISLTGNVVKINSDNFILAEDGTITANNGNFKGNINGSSIKGGTIDLFDSSTTEGSSLSLWENEDEIGSPMGHYMTLYSGGLYCGDDSLGTAVRLDSGGYIGCDSLGVADSVEVFGNLRVYGSKNRIVEIENNKKVLLNAYETATPYFGDIGSDKTNNNGYCKIYIEDVFSQTIENDDYKVFIQECGEGHLYVKKYNNYFEVIGTPNLDFDYEIKAIQKGYKNIRLKEFDKGGK